MLIAIPGVVHTHAMRHQIAAVVLVALALGAGSAMAAGPDVPTCSLLATQHHWTLRKGAYNRYCGPGRVVAQVGGKTLVITGGACDLGNGRIGFGVIGFGAPGRGIWLRMEEGWTPRQSGRFGISDGNIQLPGFRPLPHTGTAIIAKDLKSATFTLGSTSPRVTGRWTCGAARRSH